MKFAIDEIIDIKVNGVKINTEPISSKEFISKEKFPDHEIKHTGGKMENKYNCDAYDSGYCYYLARPLTDEEDDKCEDKCCAYGKKEDFIKYAKEVYDIDINLVPSNEPDTFDTFFKTIEPKQKYVIVFGDASTCVIESNGYPNLAQYGIADDVHNVVAIVKCE